MARCPSEHRTGDTEIVMMSGQTAVHGPGVAVFDLQRFELREGFLRHRRIDDPHQP